MPTLKDIDACVFDAYGTLFDVAAAAEHCQEDLGDQWAPLAQIWRDKQLQYTWLRSLMGEYVPFWDITQDALDYGLATLKIDDESLRNKLLDIYLQLDAYPEVAEMLRKLKEAELKRRFFLMGHQKCWRRRFQMRESVAPVFDANSFPMSSRISVYRSKWTTVAP